MERGNFSIPLLVASALLTAPTLAAATGPRIPLAASLVSIRSMPS